MSKASLSLSLCTIGCLYASTTQAQVTSDGTVNTQVNQNGNVAEITGGETRGGNLFHSFQDFSVPTNNEAFFNNAEAIANIFSRVTGGNISNIDGLIKANGSASLFLINPAGIIFGENAQLDLGGSFYGSTASSILFEDGEFSAVDNIEQPILTINAPIGLGFREEPGDIINRSVAGGFVEVLEFRGSQEFLNEIPVGLEVKPGRNISLIGGEVMLENGNIYAPGGKVELGGLSEAGVVSISNDGSFNFPDNIARSNVSLTNIQQQENGSTINVAGDGGGSIKVHARNLELIGRSLFLGGIRDNSIIPNVQAGDINIDATDNIFLNTSRIDNLVSPDSEGNSGDINIETKNLSIITSRDSSSRKDGSRISASSWGRGDAGNITINASERVSLDSGVNLSGRIQTAIERGGIGNGGDININTGSLLMIGRNQIRANTFAKGDAGNITINASERVSLRGVFISNRARFSTMILSQERPGAEGNSGEIIINTPLLSLSDYSIISTSAQSGQGGDIRITVEDLFLRNTSRINVGGAAGSTSSNGGNLFIDARFIVAFPEQSTDIIDFPNNTILAATDRGNGGNINITAEGIFGIEEREPEPGVNSISASSNLGIDGTVSIDTPQVDAIQTDPELPTNLIESEQTVAQACSANREIAAKSGLTISGKGGIVPEPSLPLDALNVYTYGGAETEAVIPEALETSQGKIQPARGIRVTEKGIVLTAYRTNNKGERLPETKLNCS